jgi:hypothetical protein
MAHIDLENVLDITGSRDCQYVSVPHTAFDFMPGGFAFPKKSPLYPLVDHQEPVMIKQFVNVHNCS